MHQTLSQFAHSSATVPHTLAGLLEDIVAAACEIARMLSRAGLEDIGGVSGVTNATGDEQQRLDVLAHHIVAGYLRRGRRVCALASEEAESLEPLDTRAPYVVAIDPLDGSSNIEVNVPVGLIFSIYPRTTPAPAQVVDADALQPGVAQIAAGYALYGSSTMLVYTTGDGVNGFTYDAVQGQFLLSHPRIRIPREGKIYSVNEGAFDSFDVPTKRAIHRWRTGKCKARYVGSLVADFHRNLLKGGVYLYPSSAESPEGKLRLLYECNALAWVAEQAGGKAYCGVDRTLEVTPRRLHQRTPFYVGSSAMVDDMLRELLLRS